MLVYDGDRCVGWCQFGSPPEIPNIKNRGAYDRGADDPPDWRIGCIFTSAKDRGRGVAAAAVAAALEEIKRVGGGWSRPIRSRPTAAAAAWRLSAHWTGGVVCAIRLHAGEEDREVAVGQTHQGLIPAARRRSRKAMLP